MSQIDIQTVDVAFMPKNSDVQTISVSNANTLHSRLKNLTSKISQFRMQTSKRSTFHSRQKFRMQTSKQSTNGAFKPKKSYRHGNIGRPDVA
jgi:hypothetical protein